MEKRILLDLQVIQTGAVPGPVTSAAAGGAESIGQALLRVKRLRQAPAIALAVGEDLATLLALTVQRRT